MIYTDHKALTFALSHITETTTASHQRHLSFIAECSLDIQHITSNALAELLSRPAQPVAAAALGDCRYGKAVVTSDSIKVSSRSLSAVTAVGSSPRVI
jgi:hypothetical protein